MVDLIPKVSINIITYNRDRLLVKALDSVLEQSFQDWELIVVDDCSTDNTFELVKKYSEKDLRIKYHKNNSNLGIGKSRNLALSLSAGKYIAVLDSDDYWVDKEKLKKQVDVLDGRNYVLVGGGCCVVDVNGQKQKEFLNQCSDKKIRSIFLIKNPFVNSSIMFSKAEAVKVGGYDESLRVGEDYDLFLKLGLVGKMTNISEVVVNYCQHNQNVSKLKIVNALEDNLKIIRQHKNNYPNYFFALLRRSIRLFILKLLIRIT